MIGSSVTIYNDLDVLDYLKKEIDKLKKDK